MGMPRFRAEGSLYTGGKHYQTARVFSTISK